MASVTKKTTATEEITEPKIERAVETISAPAIEMQENVREAVEKGATDTRAAYAKAKTAAEEAGSALEASYSTASKGVVEFNTKALEAFRAHAEANFDFAKSVINAKSVSELVALQSEHARKQTEAISAQIKEIAALAQKIATDSAEPIKNQVARTFKLAV
jgi:phasin